MKKVIFYSMTLASAILLAANGLTKNSNELLQRKSADQNAPQQMQEQGKTFGLKALQERDNSLQLFPVNKLSSSVDGNNITLNWQAPTGFQDDLLLFEDFNGENLEEGEAPETIPEGWLNVDNDFDGYAWRYHWSWDSPDGIGYSIGSNSWIMGKKQILTPDNWLILPKLKMSDAAKLQYYIGAYISGQEDETYAVYVSEATTSIEDFTDQLIKETLSNPVRSNKSLSKEENATRAKWYQRNIDLSAYVGKEIYIAFRHFESTDNFAILLDNVKVWGQDSNLPIPSYTYNVYRNGELIKSNLSELTYTDSNLELGTYRYDVEVVYAAGVSEKRTTIKTIFDPEKMATIKLEAHNVWNDNTGYQIILDATASQYGESINPAAPLTINCDVPANLQGLFSHFVPADAEISCTPESLVVDGSVEVKIPAGVYDYAIINPAPGVRIWIVGKNGLADNYTFEANKYYHFKIALDPTAPQGGDEATITITEGDEQLNPVTNLTGSYNKDTKITSLKWTAPAPMRAVSFEENFEEGIPETWKNVDADGDGLIWREATSPLAPGYMGSKAVMSDSYVYGVGAVDPDNWLISPKITVPEDGKLNYWAVANSVLFAGDKYGVYISDTNDDPSSFTELFSEVVGEFSGSKRTDPAMKASLPRIQGEWLNRKIDLKDYVGKEVYIAFRHWDCSDHTAIIIDEVKVESAASTGYDDYSYNVYRGGQLLGNVTTESYEDANPPEGTHKYEVEVKYEGVGVSPKVAVEVVVWNANPNESAEIVLEAHDVWGDGSGYQILLDGTASQFGVVIPQIQAPLWGCEVLPTLQGMFTHFVPENADISCTPEHMVVDGSVVVTIPAGLYDFCIVNPEPAVNIWIAGGEMALQDDYRFEAGKRYHFKADRLEGGDHIELTITNDMIDLEANTLVYGIPANIVVDCDTNADVTIYDLQGRRIAAKKVAGKTLIPTQAGAYVVQLKVAGKSQATKVTVN